MRSLKRQSLALAVGALPALLLTACGGHDDSPAPPASTMAANSLQAVVYGSADTSVPSGANIPITMMGQMRALFDLIRKSPDFTQVVMDLGDGSPVHVLDTNTGDKFLPGKLALGLSYVLIDMKAKNDPNYADYLATYQKITTAMMQSNGADYVYANTSWGDYYYLVALNNLKARGMLNEVFSDAMLATLQQRLTPFATCSARTRAARPTRAPRAARPSMSPRSTRSRTTTRCRTASRDCGRSSAGAIRRSPRRRTRPSRR